ncbi:hypothetical protein V1525DRAFT_357542 [Lipomyces kononenkoae]|uniref:Uncharacterized protein n=1 Tax=Lipomyces kononenkoae TaxID=34357 RepID=A0ACC3T5M0_LIPKO
MVAEYFIPTAYITPHARLGEGPTYVPASHELYFVDIHRQTINGVALPESASSTSYAATNDASAPAIEVFDQWEEGASKIRTTKYAEPIGVLALTAESPDKFVVGAKHGFAVTKFGDAELKYIVDVYQTNAEMHSIMRFNDGNVDPKGRFFAGTMMQEFEEEDGPAPIGTLYRLDPDGSVSTVFEGCKIPNGLCWSADAKTMFHSDSPTKTVWRYDYDITTGIPSNKRALVKFEEPNMVPDGMTISAQGDLFIAVWGGSRIVQHDSKTGELKATYKLPAEKITCPTFGGKNLDELFVTSASQNESLDYVWNEEDAKKDQGGEIFRFKVAGHSGLPRGVYQGEL